MIRNTIKVKDFLTDNCIMETIAFDTPLEVKITYLVYTDI